MDGNGITGLLLAVTIGAIFFVPVVDIIDGSTGEVEVDNSTVTNNVGFNETYDLRGQNISAGSETIEVYDNGSGSWTTLTSGTDYTLDEDAGEIEFSDTTDLDAGDEVRASYLYQATDGIVTSISGLLPVFLALMLLVPLANKVRSEV